MTKALTQEEAGELAIGTSLRGYVIATRAEIENVFGAPTMAHDDASDKVTTEWVVDFGNEVVATIYDWKRYEMGVPEMDERIEWHIGGRTNEVLLPVERSLGIISRGWQI